MEAVRGWVWIFSGIAQCVSVDIHVRVQNAFKVHEKQKLL